MKHEYIYMRYQGVNDRIGYKFGKPYLLRIIRPGFLDLIKGVQIIIERGVDSGQWKFKSFKEFFANFEYLPSNWTNEKS